MSAKEKTPADAGVFLSVVFLWSIENGQKSRHGKGVEKVAKTNKNAGNSKEFPVFLVETAGLEPVTSCV